MDRGESVTSQSTVFRYDRELFRADNVIASKRRSSCVLDPRHRELAEPPRVSGRSCACETNHPLNAVFSTIRPQAQVFSATCLCT